MGFNLGKADGPQNDAAIKRAHRWQFAVLGPLDTQILAFCKTATRPSLIIKPSEWHHDQEVSYYAGKHVWEPVTIRFYDAENPNVGVKLFDWVKDMVVDIPGGAIAKEADEYKKEANLLMLNSEGQGGVEDWKLINAWPENVNWLELDYQSTELQLVECRVRYDRAEVTGL